ncbi:MAG TPA: SH3 domain-containing protein [Clostridiales bacterium]|nr:SH3 domain-containing protein [Clostridiales bacterium]
MVKKRLIISGCVFGLCLLAGRITVVKAEEIPIAGIDLVLNNYYVSAGEDNLNFKNYIESDYLRQCQNVAFAKVTDYVNIRSEASEEGQILGKLYTKSAATILGSKGDWYKVKSGSVTGYIKGEYLTTGADALKLVGELGTRVAVVNTTTLKVRKEANTDSEVLTLFALGDEYAVKKELDGWVKVAYEGDKTGYLSTDYVEVKTEFEEAVSIEEEQERLEEEQAALHTEQTGKDRQGSASNTTNNNSSSSSSLRDSIVQFALQFRGNPYVWGGTSLTKGTDCSGFTQSVFRNYGISIPRTSRSQAVGGKRISLSDLRPGDLVFYARNGRINHVAIYIGGGKVISASSPKTGIRVTSYNYRTPYKAARYIND